MHYDKEDLLTYVSFGVEAEVRGYDKRGRQVRSAAALSGFLPELCIGHENLLLVEQQNISQTQRRLVTYNKVAGVFQQQFNLTMDLLAMESRTEDEVFLFGNVGDKVYFKSIMWMATVFGSRILFLRENSLTWYK